MEKLPHKEAITVADFKVMKISSPAFMDNGFIPARYTCQGDNVSPALNIEGIPEEAKCLALIVEDPDAPTKTFTHWIAWNIPVTHHLKENNVHGEQGVNDFREHNYSGPCPPNGTHRYFFKVYALNKLLNLPAETDKLQLEKAMNGYIIAFGELIGWYKRK